MVISAKDSGSLADRIIKAQEEVGEMAAGYGTFSGYKMPKKETTKPQALQNVKEECVDAMIVILDILTRDFGMRAEEIDEVFQKGCEAWENVIRRKQLRDQSW